MEEYVFPSQFGPQNPYKHFDEEDGDTDAMVSQICNEKMGKQLLFFMYREI